MKRLNFYFSTKLTFDDYVYNHSFAFRCIPPETSSQKILSCSLKISPDIVPKQSKDAFGNNVSTGYLQEKHRFLDFEISGQAEINSEYKRRDFMPCFRCQSGYTVPGENLTAFHKELSEQCKLTDPVERAVLYSEKLSEKFTYEKHFTNTKTTAEQAFSQGKGVCQDYSHILLSLLRMDNIPCRYIAGLAFCDGETHSWIEIWNGKFWTGFDPTNNCYADDEYLVLSQGRDFGDCAIDRGVMFGTYTTQMQLIRSKLEEI